MNLQISPWQAVWPRMVSDRRPGIDLRPDQRGRLQVHPQAPARGGGWHCSPCSATRAAASARRWPRPSRNAANNFTCARLGQNLDPFNPHVQAFLHQGQAFFLQQTGDPAGSYQMTLQKLADLRQQQAASLAYFDVFWLFAVLAVGLVFLVLLMKRSVAEKGEHLGAEYAVSGLTSTLARGPNQSAAVTSVASRGFSSLVTNTNRRSQIRMASPVWSVVGWVSLSPLR